MATAKVKKPALLGVEVKDIVTGFQGICTGYVQYLTGCNQYLIVPSVSLSGKIEDGAWVDEQRLEKVAKGRVIVLDNSQAQGCDKAPSRKY